jgi:Ca2+-dependent lipid-binding protein
VKLGTIKHKTKKIMKNLNPRWNEKFFLYVHAPPPR